MKKLVLTIAIVAMAAIAQEQAFVYPNNDASVAVLQQQLALARTDYYKILISYRIDFLQNGKPTTFSEVCERIDTAINAVNPKYHDDGKLTFKKQYAFLTGQFADELVAYCQANPSPYDIHVALRHHGTAWAKQRLMELIMQIKLTPVQAMNCISVFVAGSINGEITDENMKEILRKLDLRYTDLLSSNKEEWSPVVAKIRTLLDRYK